MAHPVRGGLTFTPTLEEFAKERAGSPVTVLSGGNNSQFLSSGHTMTRVFSCSEIQLSELTVREEAVFLNGIERRKRDLCQEVVRSLDASTVLPAELEEKLLTKISQAIG